MLSRLQDRRDPAFERELRGAEVNSVDGEKLGTVEDVLIDPNSSELRYLIVDAGWLTTRRFLIPVEQLFAGPTGDDLNVGLTKEDVRRLPEFREAYLDSAESLSDYEKKYRAASHFDKSRALGRPSSRLERLREALHHSRERQADRIERDEAVRDESSAPAAAVEVTSRPVHTSAVYGVYSQQNELERAVGELKDLGFASSDISVVFPDHDKSRQFALEKSTKAPEGALAGGGTGLIVGGVLGWLAGIGALALPGVGPIIAAGPIVAAITGAGVGSAVGGIAGALIGLGVPEVEAKRVEAEIKKGGMLLTVHCSDLRFAESARKVLQRTGAKDIYTAGEQRAA